MARYETIREATQAWVGEFNAIPRGICEKLIRANSDELREVTPPRVNKRVYIYDGDFCDCEGVVLGRVDNPDDGGTAYRIELDDGRECVVSAEDFEAQYDDALPMWGTLWAFGEQLDNDWLADEGGIQAMADCGFRIYEQEDYQYIFGIDGAGYDFYSEHWIPLYKARGLQWHKKEEVPA